MRIGHIDGRMAVGHGMRRIAHIDIKRFLDSPFRVRPTKVFRLLAEIKFFFCASRGGQASKLVQALLPVWKSERFLQRQRAFVMQPVGKPRRLDFLPIIGCGV